MEVGGHRELGQGRTPQRHNPKLCGVSWLFVSRANGEAGRSPHTPGTQAGPPTRRKAEHQRPAPEALRQEGGRVSNTPRQRGFLVTSLPRFTTRKGLGGHPRVTSARVAGREPLCTQSPENAPEPRREARGASLLTCRLPGRGPPHPPTSSAAAGKGARSHLTSQHGGQTEEGFGPQEAKWKKGRGYVPREGSHPSPPAASTVFAAGSKVQTHTTRCSERLASRQKLT